MIQFNLSTIGGFIDTENLTDDGFLKKLKSIGITIVYDDMEGAIVESSMYGEAVAKEKFEEIYLAHFHGDVKKIY